MKLVRCLLVAVLLNSVACRASDDTVATAASIVVEDLLPRAPAGHRPYLAHQWQIPMTDSIAPVPADVLERLRAVSGLPLAGSALVRSRDSAVVVLYMFRPHVVRPDSVLVLAGWLGLTGGDGGGAWGEEYEYVLDCQRDCRLLNEPAASTWN